MWIDVTESEPKNIGFRDAVPVRQCELDALDAHYGVSLLPAILEFYRRFNGAKLPLNELAGSEGNVALNQFIPASEVLHEVRIFEFSNRGGVLPIAWAEGGNYVAVDVLDGKVYFVDHEVHDGGLLIAPNIEQLLQNLISSAPASGPSAGKILQIDADFLRRIQAGEFK